MKSQNAVSNSFTYRRALGRMVKWSVTDSLGRCIERSAALSFTALLAATVVACHPNDEKVSNRAGGFTSQTGGETDAALGDRVTEYSRSMLVEVADVARQAEGALGRSASALLPVKPVSCRESKPIYAGPTGFAYETQMTACAEKGPNFEGKQSGRETYTIVTKSSAGATTPNSASNAVISFKVEGSAIETTLTPKVNPRDSLRVETNRTLDAKLISETETERLYEFTYENNSPYSLNLKAFTDGGSVTSEVRGVLVYNVADAKVTALRDGAMSIKVDSARTGRGGGRLIRQEFRGAGIVGGNAKTLAIDLAACALPQGSVEMQFSVRPVLAREKEHVVDSSTVIESFSDHVVNTKTEPNAATLKATAKLCSAPGQITVTEFYAGLLY